MLTGTPSRIAPVPSGKDQRVASQHALLLVPQDDAREMMTDVLAEQLRDRPEQLAQVQLRGHGAGQIQQQAEALVDEALIERGLEHLGERVEEVPFLGEKGALVRVGPRLAVHDVERPFRPIAGSKGGAKRPRRVAVPRRRPDDPRVTRTGFGDVGKLERRRQETGDAVEQIGRGGGRVGKNARGLPQRRQLLDSLGEPVGHVGGVLRILHGRL